MCTNDPALEGGATAATVTDAATDPATAATPPTAQTPEERENAVVCAALALARVKRAVTPSDQSRAGELPGLMTALEQALEAAGFQLEENSESPHPVGF